MEKWELKNQGIEVQFLVSKVMEDAAILGNVRLIDDDYFWHVKEYLPAK